MNHGLLWQNKSVFAIGKNWKTWFPLRVSTSGKRKFPLMKYLICHRLFLYHLECSRIFCDVCTIHSVVAEHIIFMLISKEITIYRRDEKRTNSWKKQTKSLISSLPIHLKQQPMMTMNSDDDAGLNDGCCPSSVKVTFENDVKVNSLTSNQ